MWNGERRRKWRDINSLHFLIYSLFYPSLSISYIKNCLILSQNVKYGIFVANFINNLTYARWENNSGLRESSASCEGLSSSTCKCWKNNDSTLAMAGQARSWNLSGTFLGTSCTAIDMSTRLRVKHRVWWPTSESTKASWWTCPLFFTASLQVVNLIASTAPDFIAHFNNSFSAFVQVPGATPMAENFWSSCLLSDKLLLLSFLLSLSLQKIFQQSFSSFGDSSCNFPHLHCCQCHTQSLSSLANSSSRSVIGVFGHTATFDAGCFGYVSDITTKEERTKRMGFALGDLTSPVVPPQSLLLWVILASQAPSRSLSLSPSTLAASSQVSSTILAKATSSSFSPPLLLASSASSTLSWWSRAWKWWKRRRHRFSSSQASPSAFA